MLKHNLRLFALVILMVSSANAVVAQVSPVKDSTGVPAITDTIVDEAKEAAMENIPLVSLDENDGLDGSAQNLSSQVNTGRNPFINAASFNFNVVRFRIRGYDSDMFGTFMNGVPMENLDNGFTPYGLWSGLNDVFRNRAYTPGLQSVSYGVGGIGGNTFIDARAFRQRKQTSITFASANRNYNNSIRLTKSTGWNKKGWAFSVSGARRWALEGYSDGTYFDAWSFFAGVDKRINNRHILSFVAFAAPTETGRQGATVQEMRDIAGTNYYNPYWGYQNGKKRNSSVGKTFQPVGILTHDWKINDKSSLLTAVSFSSGQRGTTGLDWYNAADPRPDYYRYLPSYQTDPAAADQVLKALQSDVNKRQINWDALYNANYGNYETIQNVDGIPGNTYSGKRSVYIVEDRVVHTNRFNINTAYNTVISKHVDLSAGLTFEAQRNHYYKKVNDLLGGDFYVDINQFAERDFPSNPNAGQNDLNHPNRILHVGDRFGYNYDINVKKTSAWVQTNVKLRKINFFLAAEHSYTNFYRFGRTRNGLFPENSHGASAQQNFYNYAFKGGLTYLVSPHNYVFLNGGYETKAPFFENVYLSPRTRDNVQDDLRSQQINSLEAGYVLIAPTVKFRATGYYTVFKHGTDVMSFYNDLTRSFTNYAINNIGKEHLGVEAGTEVIVYKGLSINASAAIGRYRYNTEQVATVTDDNYSNVLYKEKVYAKNFHVAAPQQAYNIGFYYRSPKFWWFSTNFNYFDQMYLNFSPVRRTALATDGVDPNSDQWHAITDQVQLKGQCTLDAFAGWSILMNKHFKSLGKRTFLVFNVGVNNILNNTSIVTGGYEQLRFDFVEKNPNKFPDKRFYAYGINYQASVALRF